MIDTETEAPAPAPAAPTAALQDATRRLDAIINNTTMAIFVMDERQQCAFMNRAAEALTGYRFEETQGRPLHDVIHNRYPDGRHYPLEECPIDRAFPERNQVQGEELFVHKDGSFYPVAFTASPIRDDGGQPIGTIIEARAIAGERAQQAALRESEERLRAVTDSVDQMIWSTRADGHHDYFNQRWYDFTGVEAGATDGESWNRLFHPDDRKRTWDTWRQSLGSGAPYHIEYRLRHRSGEFRWVLGRAQPVRNAEGEIVRWYGTCTDIQDLKEAETELRRTSALLHLIGDSTPDMIYAKDRDSRILYANRAAIGIIGRPAEQVIGHSDLDWAEDPTQARAIVANDQAVMASGETRDVDEAFTTPGGDTRHYRSVKSPLRDSEGAIIGLVGVTSDVTTRRQAEERERLLAREVDHRAKNLLAVVQSIVQLTRADDIAGFTRSLSGRIQSLARAHSLLAASRWEGADLKQLMTEELAPFAARGSGRVSIAGPATKLRPEAAQALALVIHELATNAAKYGALSGEAGQVEIEWSLAVASEEPRLCIRWRERDGPAVTGAPTRRGFGSTVMQASVERQLKGKVRLDWETHGLTCELALPAEQIVAAAGDGWLEREKAGAAAKAPTAEASSEGLRVLVLEDEALIAMQIEEALAAAACTVVGPATRIGEAFDLLYAQPVDAALLDVNVAGERSFAIADILAAKQIPFAFVTGFDAASTLPEYLRSASVLSKPFETAQLEAVIAQLAARTAQKS
jgi:PAS domain S-box-containing protein